MTLWTNYFLNYGGEFLDAKGNILTDGPEAIEATKYYRHLDQGCASGLAGFNWMESLAAFAQGRAAMWIDGVGWAPGVEDPNASRIAGKVGYAMVQAGPKGFSATYGDGMGVAAASGRKPLTCLPMGGRKQNGARLLQAGGGVPFRNSVLDAAREVRKGVKLPAWLQSVIDAAKMSKLGLPVIIPVAEFRDLVGAAITSTLSGADPAAELKKAHDQLGPIGAQRKGVSTIAEPAKVAAVSAGKTDGGSTIVLAVRFAGVDRRSCRHHISLAVHNLDEPERVEGRHPDDLRRPR